MAKTEPNSGLVYGWERGESGWNAGMDNNLKTIGRLIHKVALSIENSPPVAAASGSIYIVGETPSGAFSGKKGQIAALFEGAWTFYVPSKGWRFVAGEFQYEYDGTNWNKVDIEISAEEGNAIEQLPDGLFVSKGALGTVNWIVISDSTLTLSDEHHAKTLIFTVDCSVILPLSAGLVDGFNCELFKLSESLVATIQTSGSEEFRGGELAFEFGSQAVVIKAPEIVGSNAKFVFVGGEGSDNNANILLWQGI